MPGHYGDKKDPASLLMAMKTMALLKKKKKK